MSEVSRQSKENEITLERTWQTLPCSRNATFGSGSLPVRLSTATFLLEALQTGAADL